MDLNDLYHRHGASLMMAERAFCPPSHDAHRTLARVYVRRLAGARRQGKR